VTDLLAAIVELTFRITNCRFLTRDCIPYVRSGLSQLVIRVKGFRVSALHCVRANDLDFAFAFEVLSFSAWTPHFRESSFALLAHGPRWLVLLSRHRKVISAAANQKPFVNKDLCTRKSVKQTIKEVRAKRLALAWQLKMSGSFSKELNNTHTTTRLPHWQRLGKPQHLCVQRQHSSQATSKLGDTPNLHIGSHTKGTSIPPSLWPLTMKNRYACKF